MRRPCLIHFNKEQTPPGDLFDPSPRIHGGCFGVWLFNPPLARPVEEVLGHTSSEALKM
jgi:hypothetical protein